MGDRPVTAIWGIGERTARRLAEAGVHTVHDLAWADHEDLARRFGPRIGPSLRVLGLGGDHAPVVDEPWVPAVAQQGDDLPSATSPTRTRSRDEVRAPGREVTASVVAEGRTRDPRARQGPHRHVLHPHQVLEAARADDRPRRGGRAGAWSCSTASSPPGASACWACG